MALETFNVCPNGLGPETVPPEPTSVMSMNGWDFSQKPSVPYRRKFKVALHGMNWYLLANGLYDEVTDPTHNARLPEKSYQRHQLHAAFNWGHPHIGPLIDRKSTRLNSRHSCALRLPSSAQT